MIVSFTPEQLAQAGPDDLSDPLERGNIVQFPEVPIELPHPADLDFMRSEMPKLLRSKNISYHPEQDKIVGISGDPAAVSRAQRLLKAHSERVQAFLRRAMPNLTRDWQVGTASFRPLQEKGRNLSAHASNELVHVDAGAYGATHGDRVLRFFVNVNPSEDRVWVSKGAFPELYSRFGREAGIVNGGPVDLEEGPLDRLRTGAARALGAVVPGARLLDSSPYDRAMRRFHNFMKDTPSFQAWPDGHREFRFKPFTAWMVFTDMVSHACIEGQYAFIDTFVIRLASCRLPDMAPINILKRGA
ncbi:MAG TPA: Kdo hydroxylase family protein [Planctomycetota bacterium]|nr:Kdo hydroxylase family protein [Planctomycetota bacterium]